VPTRTETAAPPEAYGFLRDALRDSYGRFVLVLRVPAGDSVRLGAALVVIVPPD